MGESAWDCMQHADHHLDNAGPRNDVEDPEDLGAVDGEDLGDLGAVDGVVVVGAQGQKVDPRFASVQGWLKRETVEGIGRPVDAAVTCYGSWQLVGGRMRVGGTDDG